MRCGFLIARPMSGSGQADDEADDDNDISNDDFYHLK